ncbi:LysE family translocator, partial [Bradyrhizobium sp.]|uniref:LysE family translocator n=1 Tax=Bradyrhizobium sp. TaxID=376 RepID=UPI00391A01EC
MSAAFLLTSLIVVASPGTGVLYTLAVALTRGSRMSIAAAFGCTLGIIPAMLAAIVGLAAVLHTSALAFAALKYCGVAYLLYMAWQTLGERGALAVEAQGDARSAGRVVLTGFLINILGALLRVVLAVAILGFFGVQTTSFAALLAGAGVAIGAAWSGML